MSIKYWRKVKLLVIYISVVWLAYVLLMLGFTSLLMYGLHRGIQSMGDVISMLIGVVGILIVMCCYIRARLIMPWQRRVRFHQKYNGLL